MASPSKAIGLGALLVAALASAQLQPQPPNTQLPVAQGIPGLRPDYELGPNDQILITVPELPEINGRPFRIDSDGNIDLPLINRVHAAGLTQRGLENSITAQLRDYVREPHVSITVTVFRTEIVVFTGAFARNGIYPLQGGRSLVEMLAVAGGLLPNAGRRIKVTRRAEYGAIDLPNAVKDPQRGVSYVEISLDSLTQNINPAEDLVLKAYDVVSADIAQPIYVEGEVKTPGVVMLGPQASLSVMQVLGQVGGFTPNASRGRVRILRPVLGTTRRAEIEVDLSKIYEGKGNDLPLLPNDVLFVPRASVRAVLAPVGTGLLTSLPYLMISLAIGGVF